MSYPNPEEAAALAMAIELGKKTHADVVMATDPDADRSVSRCRMAREAIRS